MQSERQLGRNGVPRGTGRRAGRRAGRVVLVLMAAAALSGCGVVAKVRAVVQRVEANRATVDAFTGRLQSGEAKPFAVTYATTGGAPATVQYAVDPPDDLAFTDTASSGAVQADVVTNASGQYICSPPGTSGATWTCQKQPPSGSSSESALLDLYTPAHWVTFLKDLTLAASFAGAKVTDSTMTVNGFALQCVDFRVSGTTGTSTVCSTAQGVLGYVQVASDSTAFEIEHYTTSPAASLFELPAGAKVTVASSGSPGTSV